MIAAHAFGDIVIETRKKFDFESRMNVCCDRKLLFVVLVAESAHVSNNLKVWASTV